MKQPLPRPVGLCFLLLILCGIAVAETDPGEEHGTAGTLLRPAAQVQGEEAASVPVDVLEPPDGPERATEDGAAGGEEHVDNGLFHVDGSHASHGRRLLEGDGVTPSTLDALVHDVTQVPASADDEQQPAAGELTATEEPAAAHDDGDATAAQAALAPVTSSDDAAVQDAVKDTDTAQSAAHGAHPKVADADQMIAREAAAAAGAQQHAQPTPAAVQPQLSQQERPKRQPTIIPTPDDFERENSAAEKAAAAAAAVTAAAAGGTLGLVPHGGDTTAGDVPGLLAGLGAAGVTHGAGLEQEGARGGGPGSEDEGRRINLASAADGASVVAANKEARKPEKSIDSDDDSFMKNICSANKWIILELSQLGRVDEVQLVNKEMYSSRVKEFVVKGRQSHPRKDGSTTDYARAFDSDSWQLMGNFTAANKKGSQSFKMPVRRRVRYLLLQFLTHYGSEEVCALNSISVLGVSAAQELEEALARHLHPEPAVELGETPLVVVTPAQVAAVVTSAGVLAAAPQGVTVLPGGAAPSGMNGVPHQGVPHGMSAADGAAASTTLAGAAVAAVSPAGQTGGTAAAEGAARQLPPIGVGQTATHATLATLAPQTQAQRTVSEVEVEQHKQPPAGAEEPASGTVHPVRLHPHVSPLLGDPTASSAQASSLVNGSNVTNVTNSTAPFSHARAKADSDNNTVPPVGSLELPQLPAVADAAHDSAGFSHQNMSAADAQGEHGTEHALNHKSADEAPHANGDGAPEEEGDVDGALEMEVEGAAVEAVPSEPTAAPGASAKHAPGTSAAEAGEGAPPAPATGAAGVEEPVRAVDVTAVSGETQPCPVASNLCLSSEVPTLAPEAAAAAGIAGATGAAPAAAESTTETPDQLPVAVQADKSAITITTLPTLPSELAGAVSAIHTHAHPAAEPHPLGGSEAVQPVIPLPLPNVLADVPPIGYFDALLSAMEGGPAAKPKQAGNLFDVFKQEFMIMRLNQTRMWKYITSLVEVLNKNAASAHEEVTRLEGVVSQLRTQLAILPAQVEADTLKRVAELPRDEPAQIQQLALAVAQLQRDVKQGRLREYALLLYSSALLGAMLSNMGARNRSFRRLLMTLSIFNGVVGLTLQSPMAQKYVLQVVQHFAGGAGPLWHRYMP